MRLLTALLLWLVLALPAYGQVGNLNLVNVRDFGATGNGVTDDAASIEAARKVAAANNACLYFPYTNQFYVMSAAVKYTSAGFPQCVTGDPSSAAQATGTTPHYQLHTTDTDCIDTNGNRVSIYNISCFGNGMTSSSATQTVCINAAPDSGYDSRLENINCAGYVTGLAVTDRTRGNNFTDDNDGLAPNLTNNFPSYCIHNIGSSGNSVEVTDIKGIFCRDNAWVTTVQFVGDGATTYKDFSLNASSGISGQASVMWASDSIKACQADLAGALYPCVPLVAGTDYTVWDCGASACGGSGGTQLLVVTKTVGTTADNPQISMSSTTGLSAGTQYRVFGEHDLKMPAYVVSVDNGTHVTLSNAPGSTNSAVKYTFYQVNVSAGACHVGTSPTCGYNIEVRFTTAPPSNINTEIQWTDPWSEVAIYQEKGAESTYEAQMIGGIRTAFQTGCAGCYGSDKVDVTYWEIGNYCAILNEGGPAGGFTGHITGETIRMARNVRGGGVVGGLSRCGIWFDPKGVSNRLIWNGSDWRWYQGSNVVASAGGSIGLTIGSSTAPLNSVTGELELNLSNVVCAGGSSNLQIQVSEDGTNMLAGTNYTYRITDDLPSGAGSLSSTGAAAIPLSNNGLDTTGAYTSYITIGSPGLAVSHPIGVKTAMVDSAGNSRSEAGSGIAIGTPAALKALKISCGSGGSGPLMGQILYREVW